MLLLIVPAIGQSQASKPAFETASIHENTANDRSIWPPERSGARTIVHGVTLGLVVHYAWNIGNPFQVSFPASMPSEKYDIETVSDGTPDEDQLRLMFQSLLEDRFKLKTHYEQREIDQWDLIVSKPGKLKPADPKSIMTVSGILLPPGITSILTESDGRHIVCSGCSIVQIANGFSRILGAPVANKINLDGAYSYDAPLDESPPNIPLVADELGLKLLKSKVSLRVLIIDHIEKPTPN